MSDTGGGHRAAAEAIQAGLYQKYADQVEVTVLDVLRECRFPVKHFPELYPLIINHTKTAWSLAYRISNTQRSVEAIARTMYAINAARLQEITEEYQADVVVCVHLLLVRPMLRAWSKQAKRPPFITVVTDLVSTHNFWYDKRADITLVPTKAAFGRGAKWGIPPEKMTVTGLPVHPNFLKKLSDTSSARSKLNWQQDTPTVLLVAGGDGMGPLLETAESIDQLDHDIQLAIVAGRNSSLKEKLDQVPWRHTTHVYGFVDNMPELMDASDVIVTKAGPGTLTEAAIAGLPMILMDAIPGQEDGNVQYVLEHNAGAWAPSPKQATEVLNTWLLEGPERLKERSVAVKQLADPEAVWRIADIVMEY